MILNFKKDRITNYGNRNRRQLNSDKEFIEETGRTQVSLMKFQYMEVTHEIVNYRGQTKLN